MTQSTLWTVPFDHPAFAGHFPGAPILPGVLLLDAALRAIAEARGIAPDQCEICSVKFLSPAGPGDLLEIRHNVTPGGSIHFDIVAGLRKIADGRIMAVPPT